MFQSCPKSIICLQETHLDDKDRFRLNSMWRHDFAMSPSMGASGGCIILYNKASLGNIVETISDDVGRFVAVVGICDGLTRVVCSIHAKHPHSALGWNGKTVKNGKTGITVHSRMPVMKFFPFSFIPGCREWISFPVPSIPGCREWISFRSRPFPGAGKNFFNYRHSRF
jgi:hypothetical protein